jgi:hypothetical protein
MKEKYEAREIREEGNEMEWNVNEGGGGGGQD